MLLLLIVVSCLLYRPCGSQDIFNSFPQTHDLVASSFVVPDMVHQIYDYNTPNFFLFLSIQCIQHYLQPKQHILWVNIEGKHRKGAWENWLRNAQINTWEHKLFDLVEKKKLEVKYLVFPSSPTGNNSISTNNKAHKSDFVRMQLLKDYGGMYIDTDAYVISSAFHLLRLHDFTLSFDNIVNPPDSKLPKRMNNGIILSKPNALFLQIWMEKYKQFHPESFDYDSSVVPYELATQYPDLIHVEMYRISPISFAFQTTTLADAITCGLYLPPVNRSSQTFFSSFQRNTSEEQGVLWYPKFSFEKKGFFFEESVQDVYMAQQLHKRLALHLTMSQVRGICMMRKSLGSPKDLDYMPSFLGHVFRMAYYGYDDFPYEQHWYNTTVGEKNHIWKSCRDHFGMHLTPDRDDNSRQQYVDNIVHHPPQ